jgi:hypothetical protein
MSTPKINFAAVAVATLVPFLLGGLWYSPVLFGRSWIRAMGWSEADPQKGAKALTFGIALALTLVMALNLAFFLADGKRDVVWGVTAGALAGVGWVATGFGVTYVFARRSFKLYLIDAGYHAVAFMLMGGILGFWK